MSINKTIIIPAYNEEKRIWTILDQSRFYPYTYIFICDGTDNTYNIITEYKQLFNQANIKCFNYQKRLGKGGGILKGFEKCTTKYVGYMDADYSTSLDEMTRLFNILEKDYNIVIGSRWIKGSYVTTSQSLIRRLQSRALNRLVKMMFGLDVMDTQCGAKVFTTKSILKIIPEIKTKGFEFDVELLWRFSRKGYFIKEVPIEWKDVDHSHIKPACAFKMFGKLLKLRVFG